MKSIWSTRIRAAVVAAAVLLLPIATWAGLDVPSVPIDTSQFATKAQVAGLNAVFDPLGAAAAVRPGNFVGAYTVATLPTCDGSAIPFGSIAYVSDLGGGPNNAKCVAGMWQHFTQGIPGTTTTTSGTVVVTPLVSPPIMQVTGNIPLATTLTMQIDTTNLYPGYVLTIIPPATILGVLQVAVKGLGLNLPVLVGRPSTYVWTGTTLVQTQ